MADITQLDQIKAARNEGYGSFTLENPVTHESKTFELKHLNYDAYIEFCELARPILTVVSGALGLGQDNGEIKVQFDPTNIDFTEILKLAGKELPRMAWLCCKQSEPKITIDEVKRLGHRPQALIAVVLKQIKHNEMVKEFSDFFPELIAGITALIPDVQAAMAPTPIEKTEPTE